MHDVQRHVIGRRSGHTLLEALVVIALIGVLLSIAAPQLRRMTEQGRELKSLSSLRTNVQFFKAFGAERNGMHPFFLTPELGELNVPDAIPAEFDFFSARFMWAVALSDLFEGSSYASTVSPLTPQGGFSVYWYGHCFTTRPGYWRSETRREGTGQWRPTYGFEVVHPSAKGLFIDPISLWNGTTDFTIAQSRDLLIGFVDGSAAPIRRQDIREPFRLGTGTGWFFPAAAVLDTVGGVEGRDLK